MMDGLRKATEEIRTLLIEGERENMSFPSLLDKMQTVKAYGESFSTLMLMEIINEFIDDKEKRASLTPEAGYDGAEVQQKFDEMSDKWNSRNQTN